MREDRWTIDLPHSPARLWALFQDHGRRAEYAPSVLDVEVVWPGDQHGNGLLRRVVHQLPSGRRGVALELVTDVARERGYTFAVLSHRPGDEHTGTVRLEPLGPGQTRLHVEERYHRATVPGRWFEARIHAFLRKRNEETVQAASQWLTDHPEYRADLVGR